MNKYIEILNDLICEHSRNDLNIEDLSLSNLDTVISLWLLADCPNNPNDAIDYIGDSVVDISAHLTPFLLLSAGEIGGDEKAPSVSSLVKVALRENCIDAVDEYWRELIISYMQSARIGEV